MDFTAITTLSVESLATITETDGAVYTTTRAPTIIWVTYTKGYTTTQSTTFAQRFKSMYTSSEKPSSGSIGLGTISGQVGVVKSYAVATLENDAAAVAAFPIMGGLLALASWLL